MEFFRLYFLYVYYELSYDKEKKVYGDELGAFFGATFFLFAVPVILFTVLIFSWLAKDYASYILFVSYKGTITISGALGIVLSFVPTYLLRPSELTFQELEAMVRAHPFFSKRSFVKIVPIPALEALAIMYFLRII